VATSFELGKNAGICEVAWAALKEGVSLELVMKITGLSKEFLLRMQELMQD
jgi:hypothetical protein